MYRGFNVAVPDDCFGGYEEDGRRILYDQKNQVGAAIESFMDATGAIAGSDLLEDWFPMIDGDVFISHSHRDSDLAIRFAGFLKFELGLEAFVDSGVWGYANSLLKSL